MRGKNIMTANFLPFSLIEADTKWQKKKKLRAGPGAKALILTKFIRPKQPIPNNDNKHRSNIVLFEKAKDEKGKDIFRFRYELDTENDGELIYANVHYVNITMEGDHKLLFDGPGLPLRKEDYMEPSKKWGKF